MPSAPAQNSAQEERFAADSLRFRTTLHYDPLLDAPLESLVKLYVSAERTEELIGLYRSHIEQYPNDAGAKTVLFRILRRVDRAGAEELIAAAVPLHPDFAPLQFMLFRFLEDRGDPRATEALSRAIELETNETRRYDWLEQLLRLSEGEAQRSLARAHFEKWLGPEELPVETLIGLARLMQRYQFWESSIKALERARKKVSDAEKVVEVEMMLSLALAQTGKGSAAGQILDQLLAKLAASHWRRREILSLRLSVVATAAEREALLAAYRKAYQDQPGREASALDLAEVLIAAEKPEEAEKVLVEASARLPEAPALERRALELLENSGNLLRYAAYLTDKLERDPARLDLRFRLVKAAYAMGQDAAAEQDFKAVMAGLAPADASERILELQRYLRGIDRIDAAASYLSRYVRNHPTRLDVARELSEIYISQGQDTKIADLVREIDPAGAEADKVIDLAGFLLAEDLVQAARTVLEARLAEDPRDFELGLLWIEVLGKAGDAAAAQEAITRFRDLTDTTPRYARWLEAASSAHRSLETLPGFFDSELARYNFAEGKWSADKIDKFLVLCESGKQQLYSDRIAEGLRQQLRQAGLDPNLRLRLRRALVGVLEQNPAAAAEVEEQLRALSAEDPTRRAEHDLRRALVYHRSQRIDLAQDLVDQIELAEVTNVPLLREVSEVLVGYGFLREAETALATITKLEPGDLLSWESRLSVLAALGRETDLRAAIRSLRSGESGTTLRDSSNRALDLHLDASYWRSVALLMRAGTARAAEILPLLAAVERESRLGETVLWSEWTRAFALTRLGQVAEAEAALSRLKSVAGSRKVETIRFPDGLELALSGASTWLLNRPAAAGPAAEGSAAFLLEGAVMRWAFELPEETRLLRLEKAGAAVLVLDDLDQVSALDATSGKLLWRRQVGGAGEGRILPPPTAFADFEDPGRLIRRDDPGAVASRRAPLLKTAGERFYVMRDRDLCAYAATDGNLLWVAALPQLPEPGPVTGGKGAPPMPLLEIAEDRVVLYDPVPGRLQAYGITDGKLLWDTELRSGESPAGPPPRDLQTGLSLAGNAIFAYGQDSVVADLQSGRVIWRLETTPPPTFPLVLRPMREGGTDVADVAEATPATAGEGTPTGSGGAPDPLQSVRFIDFQSGEPGVRLTGASSAGEGGVALLSPAYHWARTRRESPDAAAALLSPGTLWLMKSGQVRRISSDLPVASIEMEAGGALIGAVADHLWFLDGSTLRHLDFPRSSASRISLDDLGSPGDLRATLVGNHLVVRGSSSILVLNALTGLPLGRVAFPGPLTEYLTAFPVAAAEAGKLVWQGRIETIPSDPAGRCLPIADLVSESLYVTVFDDRRIVCLERQPTAPAPAATTPN